MEPPRIYRYEGLFSSHRSIDIALKILLVVTCFVIFILLLARHLTRKKYRRAPLKSIPLRNLKDAYHCDFLPTAWNDLKDNICMIHLNRKNILCVNDWKLIILHDQSSDFDCLFSCAPKSLRRGWYGLLLSDSTLNNRAQLRSILLHTFDSFPTTACQTVGSRAADVQRVDRYLSDTGLLELHGFDDWIWFIVTEFLFFNSMVYEETGDIPSGRIQLSNCLRKCIDALQHYHVYGYSEKSIVPKFFRASKLLLELEHLLSPLIEFSEQASQSCKSSHIIQSFLHQFVRTRRQLEAEGDPTSFLKTAHVVHTVSEISMLLNWILKQHLTVLFYCLSSKPAWEERLLKEVTDAFDSSSSGSQVPRCLLLQQTQILVWTKAMVIETMRLCAIGWPFGCIRQAVRDGQLNDWDYLEDELIILNQPAYLSDKQLWKDVTIRDDHSTSLTFNPSRFITSESTVGNKQQLSIPVHFARFLLTGYTVCIPHESIYRLLMSIITQLFYTGWRVHDHTSNGTLEPDDQAVRISSPIPFVPISAPLD